MTGGASCNHRPIFNPSSAQLALAEGRGPRHPTAQSWAAEATISLGGLALRGLLCCRLTDGLLRGCLLGGRLLALRCCFSHWNSLPLEFESARTNKTCASSRNLLTKKFDSAEKNWLLNSFCCTNAAIFLFFDAEIGIDLNSDLELNASKIRNTSPIHISGDIRYGNNRHFQFSEMALHDLCHSRQARLQVKCSLSIDHAVFEEFTGHRGVVAPLR